MRCLRCLPLIAFVLALGCAGSRQPLPTARGPLSLSRVVLYRNGVGYFERTGVISGDRLRGTRVRLSAVTLDGKPDLVVVANPTHLHVEQARFDRVYRRAKQVLDDGELGAVHGARIHFGHDLAAWRPTVDVQHVYSAHHAQGGGIALDAIHELDLAHWWFGPVWRTAASCRSAGRFNDIEDVAHFTLEHESGVVTHLDLNCLDPFYRRGASIAGSRAVCAADFAARRVVIRSRQGAERVHEFTDSDRNEMYVEESLTLSMRDASTSAVGGSGG